MKKITGITLATIGVLGVAGAIKFGKATIQIHKNNNTAYPGSCETLCDKYYETLSQSMFDDAEIIKSKTASSQEKLEAVKQLKELLHECLTIRELDELTAIYRDEPSSLILGYDPIAVSRFIYKFHREAKNGNLKPMTEHREIAEPDNAEEESFKKCFTCDCEDDVDESIDLFAYYEECERIAEYSKIAHAMNKDIKYIRGKSSLNGLKRITAMNLNDQLTYLLDNDEITDLVDIYRDHRDNSTLGFNSDKVNEFVLELRKRYTTKPEAGEYFEVMLENDEHVQALQTLFEFLYEEAELGVNRNDYVKDFIYKVEMDKLHVGKLIDETGTASFEFYINDELVAYGDEDLNLNEPTNEDPGYTLRVSFLDNVEYLATEYIPNIMKHLLKDKYNFAKKALSEGYE
jgi:hypothetical protein